MSRVYASTTYLGPGRTELARALEQLAECGLDGVALGSTHLWRPDLAEIARRWTGAKVTHNYFPPAAADLVINLASTDQAIRAASLAHAGHCLEVAADIGASLYTVHPGFLADAEAAAATRAEGGAYDFTFAVQRSPRAVAFALMLDALSRLAERAERLGVGLAVESEGSATHQGILLLESPQEYDALFQAIPTGLGIDFNLAHSGFAARVHGFDLGEFIARFADRMVLVELSDNDGHADLHRPLVPGSAALDWLGALPDVPLVLEFRDATAGQVAQAAALVRAARP